MSTEFDKLLADQRRVRLNAYAEQANWATTYYDTYTEKARSLVGIVKEAADRLKSMSVGYDLGLVYPVKKRLMFSPNGMLKHGSYRDVAMGWDVFRTPAVSAGRKPPFYYGALLNSKAELVCYVSEQQALAPGTPPRLPIRVTKNALTTIDNHTSSTHEAFPEMWRFGAVGGAIADCNGKFENLASLMQESMAAYIVNHEPNPVQPILPPAPGATPLGTGPIPPAGP